jgi:hypothetical protein
MKKFIRIFWIVPFSTFAIGRDWIGVNQVIVKFKEEFSPTTLKAILLNFKVGASF